MVWLVLRFLRSTGFSGYFIGEIREEGHILYHSPHSAVNRIPEDGIHIYNIANGCRIASNILLIRRLYLVKKCQVVAGSAVGKCRDIAGKSHRRIAGIALTDGRTHGVLIGNLRSTLFDLNS